MLPTFDPDQPRAARAAPPAPTQSGSQTPKQSGQPVGPPPVGPPKSGPPAPVPAVSPPSPAADTQPTPPRKEIAKADSTGSHSVSSHDIPPIEVAQPEHYGYLALPDAAAAISRVLLAALSNALRAERALRLPPTLRTQLIEFCGHGRTQLRAVLDLTGDKATEIALAEGLRAMSAPEPPRAQTLAALALPPDAAKLVAGMGMGELDMRRRAITGWALHPLHPGQEPQWRSAQLPGLTAVWRAEFLPVLRVQAAAAYWRLYEATDPSR